MLLCHDNIKANVNREKLQGKLGSRDALLPRVAETALRHVRYPHEARCGCGVVRQSRDSKLWEVKESGGSSRREAGVFQTPLMPHSGSGRPVAGTPRLPC